MSCSIINGNKLFSSHSGNRHYFYSFQTVNYIVCLGIITRFRDNDWASSPVSILTFNNKYSKSTLCMLLTYVVLKRNIIYLIIIINEYLLCHSDCIVLPYTMSYSHGNANVKKIAITKKRTLSNSYSQIEIHTPLKKSVTSMSWGFFAKALFQYGAIVQCRGRLIFSIQ